MDDLANADEVFLASTTREVQPVVAIDGHRFDGPGPVTRRTAEAAVARIRAELAS